MFSRLSSLVRGVWGSGSPSETSVSTNSTVTRNEVLEEDPVFDHLLFYYNRKHNWLDPRLGKRGTFSRFLEFVKNRREEMKTKHINQESLENIYHRGDKDDKTSPFCAELGKLYIPFLQIVASEEKWAGFVDLVGMYPVMEVLKFMCLNYGGIGTRPKRDEVVANFTMYIKHAIVHEQFAFQKNEPRPVNTQLTDVNTNLSILIDGAFLMLGNRMIVFRVLYDYLKIKYPTCTSLDVLCAARDTFPLFADMDIMTLQDRFHFDKKTGPESEEETYIRERLIETAVIQDDLAKQMIRGKYEEDGSYVPMAHFNRKPPAIRTQEAAFYDMLRGASKSDVLGPLCAYAKNNRHALGDHWDIATSPSITNPLREESRKEWGVIAGRRPFCEIIRPTPKLRRDRDEEIPVPQFEYTLEEALAKIKNFPSMIENTSMQRMKRSAHVDMTGINFDYLVNTESAGTACGIIAAPFGTKRYTKGPFKYPDGKTIVYETDVDDGTGGATFWKLDGKSIRASRDDKLDNNGEPLVFNVPFDPDDIHVFNNVSNIYKLVKLDNVLRDIITYDDIDERNECLNIMVKSVDETGSIIKDKREFACIGINIIDQYTKKATFRYKKIVATLKRTMEQQTGYVILVEGINTKRGDDHVAKIIDSLKKGATELDNEFAKTKPKKKFERGIDIVVDKDWIKREPTFLERHVKHTKARLREGDQLVGEEFDYKYDLLHLCEEDGRLKLEEMQHTFNSKPEDHISLAEDDSDFPSVQRKYYNVTEDGVAVVSDVGEGTEYWHPADMYKIVQDVDGDYGIVSLRYPYDPDTILSNQVKRITDVIWNGEPRRYEDVFKNELNELKEKGEEIDGMFFMWESAGPKPKPIYWMTTNGVRHPALNAQSEEFEELETDEVRSFYSNIDPLVDYERILNRTGNRLMKLDGEEAKRSIYSKWVYENPGIVSSPKELKGIYDSLINTDRLQVPKSFDRLDKFWISISANRTEKKIEDAMEKMKNLQGPMTLLDHLHLIPAHAIIPPHGRFNSLNKSDDEPDDYDRLLTILPTGAYLLYHLDLANTNTTWYRDYDFTVAVDFACASIRNIGFVPIDVDMCMFMMLKLMTVYVICFDPDFIRQKLLDMADRQEITKWRPCPFTDQLEKTIENIGVQFAMISGSTIDEGLSDNHDKISVLLNEMRENVQLEDILREPKAKRQRVEDEETNEKVAEVNEEEAEEIEVEVEDVEEGSVENAEEVEMEVEVEMEEEIEYEEEYEVEEDGEEIEEGEDSNGFTKTLQEMKLYKSLINWMTHFDRIALTSKPKWTEEQLKTKLIEYRRLCQQQGYYMYEL